MSLIKTSLISTFVLAIGVTSVFFYPPALNFVISLSSGSISQAILGEELSVIELNQLLSQEKSDIILIDVRSPAEYQAEHIPNAISIPVSEIEQYIDKIKALTKNQRLVTYCAIGPRSHKALSILKQHQIEGSNLNGGFQAWWQQKPR